MPIAAPLYLGGDWTQREAYSHSGCTYSLNTGGSDSSVVLGGPTAATITINNFLESLPFTARNQQITPLGNQPGAYVVDGVSTRLINGSVSGPQPDCGTSHQSALGAWLLTSDGNGSLRRVANDGHVRGRYANHQAGDWYTDIFEWDLFPQREP